MEKTSYQIIGIRIPGCSVYYIFQFSRMAILVAMVNITVTAVFSIFDKDY